MFRSLLFIPGNNPSMLQNADVFLADAVIIDLEDAISIKEKDNARNLVHNYLTTSSVLPKQIVLRINSIDTVWYKKDLDLLKTNKINYLLIPKADSKTIIEVNEYLDTLFSNNNLDEIKLIALVETARGITEIDKFAENKRLCAILLGAEDLTNDLEIKRSETNQEIFYARSKVIFACATNKLISIDTPFTNINDIVGLEKDSAFSKSLGMKARACIHPNQLEIVNRIYSPSNEDINWALEVFKAHQANPNVGAFQLKGKMIDKPIIERAKKIIEKAKLFNLM
ncbi:MAG: CoA ester lyase [Tenericutes bacterium HGW-Tenericutes-5]|nr:MAG: CoA ester lyase [Tenericutes bacterium HGW-Tenericutes-5]